jgi:uncharacterized protein YkwD
MKPWLFVFAFFLLSLQSNATVKTTVPEPRPRLLNKTLLLQLVNEVRKKGCQCGDTYYPAAPALRWNSQLEQAALLHSNDMFANNYFSHADRTGKKAGDRIDGIGYKWRNYGENIAFGYRSENEVVKGWLLSPGHCKNIMGKSFKEMGVARVGDYWTQVFATQ